MIHILLGHRGTGKSFWLQKMPASHRFDLDQVISEQQKMPITELFAKVGEENFRQLEKQSLSALMDFARLNASAPLWIAAGAGFPWPDFQRPPEEKTEYIWLQRSTDKLNRIFLNRPRLDALMSPQQEYEVRRQAREPQYQNRADWTLEIPEGEFLNQGSQVEHVLAANAQNPLPDHGGIWTVDEKDQARFELFERRFFHWGFAAFELRTDLLNAAAIEFWISKIPHEKILLSYRNLHQRADSFRLKNEVLAEQLYDVDWALEMGPPAQGLGVTSVSLHSSAHDSIDESIRTLSTYAKGHHLKWAPLIENWPDLLRAKNWQAEDPENRSLLPRSVQGRWSWFRLLQSTKQKLHFIRESAAFGVLDQPSLLEWLNFQPGTSFAAILGEPVEHSWTPGEQAEFFAEHRMPVLRIAIKEPEWDTAFPILEAMGLRAAAVTSPLKTKAFAVSEDLSAVGAELGTVNTLARDRSGQWCGDNTDIQGFEALLHVSNLGEWSGPVVVWGGGGTLPLLRHSFPEAVFYSARSQRPRGEEFAHGSPLAGPPDALWIWAAGPEADEPKFDAKPKFIIDLNYREDSNARSLALKTGARYISGAGMFFAQADGQRKFWNKIFGLKDAGRP